MCVCVLTGLSLVGPTCPNKSWLGKTGRQESGWHLWRSVVSVTAIHREDSSMAATWQRHGRDAAAASQRQWLISGNGMVAAWHPSGVAADGHMAEAWQLRRRAVNGERPVDGSRTPTALGTRCSARGSDAPLCGCRACACARSIRAAIVCRSLARPLMLAAGHGLRRLSGAAVATLHGALVPSDMGATRRGARLRERARCRFSAQLSSWRGCSLSASRRRGGRGAHCSHRCLKHSLLPRPGRYNGPVFADSASLWPDSAQNWSIPGKQWQDIVEIGLKSVELGPMLGQCRSMMCRYWRSLCRIRPKFGPHSAELGPSFTDSGQTLVGHRRIRSPLGRTPSSSGQFRSMLCRSSPNLAEIGPKLIHAWQQLAKVGCF